MDGLWVKIHFIVKINLIQNVKLEDTLNTPDDSDIGYLIEVDLKDPDNIKLKTKFFPFASEILKNYSCWFLWKYEKN